MKHITLTQQELADISEAIELSETKQRFRRKLLALTAHFYQPRQSAMH